jgi:hypothetical protein
MNTMNTNYKKINYKDIDDIEQFAAKNKEDQPQCIKESTELNKQKIAQMMDAFNQRISSHEDNNRNTNINNVCDENNISVSRGAKDDVEKVTLPLKRDCIIIYPNNRSDSSNITKYEVYAVSFDGVTHVISVIFKKHMDMPLISYCKSKYDPSVVMDNIYKIEKEKKRGIFLRKNGARDDMKDDEELIEIAEIIKNDTYITTHSKKNIIDTINKFSINK